MRTIITKKENAKEKNWMCFDWRGAKRFFKLMNVRRFRMVVEVVFSPHARQRMIERGIEELDAIQTIRLPDMVLESFHSRKVAVKVIHHKKLQVIYKEEMGKIIVITVLGE